MTTKRTTLILALLAASAIAQEEPPYPMSTIIAELTWADATSIVHQATGSDNWPITWADDGEQYTIDKVEAYETTFISKTYGSCLHIIVS